MSKELNIIEAMKMPVGTEFIVIGSKRFKSTAEILKSDDHSCTKFLGWKGSPAYQVNICDTTIDAKFIPIEQPVSFIEAIKAGSEGKRIKVDVTQLNEKYSVGAHCVLNNYWNNAYKTINEIFTMLANAEKRTMKIIEEGKWYIEESEEN